MTCLLPRDRINDLLPEYPSRIESVDLCKGDQELCQFPYILLAMQSQVCPYSDLSNSVIGFLLKVSYPENCSKISLGIGETISVSRCFGFMYLTSSDMGTLFRSVKARTTPLTFLANKDWHPITPERTIV